MSVPSLTCTAGLSLYSLMYCLFTCTACRDKTLVISVPSLTDLSARTTPDMSNPLVVRLR